MENLAIIPARGGSKGIPRKNLALLGGRPLISYTIRQALAASSVQRVVVSTDDDEIAGVAVLEGAEVVQRPEEISGDTASSESALLHALEELQKEGYVPDLVTFLQATSPLRRPGDIDHAVARLVQENADSLFSGCVIHGFIWRHGVEQDEKQRSALNALSYDPEERPRRQDIGTDYVENGSIYVTRTELLRREGNRLGGKIAIYPMDPLNIFQIDEPADLELFQRLLPLVEKSTPDLSAIRLLVLDFDGVMTDNRVLVDQDGREAVYCDRGDGLGLEKLRRGGRVEAVVLSKEKNPVVSARCRKLGLEVHQGYDNKLPEIQKLAAQRGLDASQVAYVGNDVNDLAPMGWAGTAIAVADAVPEVLAVADHVTRKAGGRGAVREICDWLLRGDA